MDQTSDKKAAKTTAQRAKEYRLRKQRYDRVKETHHNRLQVFLEYAADQRLNRLAGFWGVSKADALARIIHSFYESHAKVLDDTELERLKAALPEKIVTRELGRLSVVIMRCQRDLATGIFFDLSRQRSVPMDEKCRSQEEARLSSLIEDWKKLTAKPLPQWTPDELL